VFEAPSVIVKVTVLVPPVLYVTVCGPAVLAVAGLAPSPKFQRKAVPLVVPSEVFANKTCDPAHRVRGLPTKSASRPQPIRLTYSVLAAPAQLAALVSVTVMLPLVVPNVTVMLFVPDPEVIIEPAGTVQA